MSIFVKPLLALIASKEIGIRSLKQGERKDLLRTICVSSRALVVKREEYVVFRNNFRSLRIASAL